MDVRATIEIVHELCENAEVEWDDLRYVLALSRVKTLSLAGASLGVSHTTVGRRLRAIEARLGVRLFDQTPEGFVTTSAGQDIVEVAERVENDVLSLEGRVLGRDAELRGKLRVATMDMLFGAFRGVFASFIMRYPSIELTTTISDTEVSLLRREADVALRLTNTPPEYLVGRRVGHADFAVYASKALADRVGPNATLDDYPWIHWDERLGMHWLDQYLAVHAPNARIAMRIDVSSRVLHEIVAAGIGVHFLSCAVGDADPGLVRIGPIEPAFGRDIWLLTLPELRSTSRIRAFMDHVVSISATPPA